MTIHKREEGQKQKKEEKKKRKKSQQYHPQNNLKSKCKLCGNAGENFQVAVRYAWYVSDDVEASKLSSNKVHSVCISDN